MEELQPFARSLRELMAHHPKDGRVTTPAELAEELGTSAQTISYYVNGKRRPSYENIISLIHYFDVSADYLLFGIEPQNLDMHKTTGLSNDAIKMLKRANVISKEPETPNYADILNRLLEDREFYTFIEDMAYQIEQINELQDMDSLERDKKYPEINMLGYSKWRLYQNISDFVFRMMQKNGLKVKDEYSS